MGGSFAHIKLNVILSNDPAARSISTAFTTLQPGISIFFFITLLLTSWVEFPEAAESHLERWREPRSSEDNNCKEGSQ